MNDVVPLRRNRSFQVLWIGYAASNMGSSVTRLALPLLILSVTGSPALAGVASTCQLAASVLVGLPAGVWVDRWDRRRIMVTCEALRLVVYSLFTLAVVSDVVAFWQVIALAVVHGGASAFVEPAHATAVQAVVPASQLRSAYAQDEARGHAGVTVGPPLGGFLFAVGRWVPFLVDAVTYLVALVCVLLARVPRRPADVPATPADTPPKRMRSDVADSLRWLNRHRGLRAVLGLALVGNMLAAAVLVPVIVLVSERGGGSVATGVVVAGLGVGGLVGSLLAPRVGRLLPPGMLAIAVHVVIALAFAATALPFGVWWPLVPLCLAWLVVPAVNVVFYALIAQMVPSAMMGRINSLILVIAAGLSPIGPAIGGFLAAGLGGAGALLVVGGAMAVASLVALSSRELRGLEGSTEPEPDPTGTDPEPAEAPA